MVLAVLLGLTGCPGGLDVSRYGDRGAAGADGGSVPIVDGWGTAGSEAKPISLDVKAPKADSGPAPTPDSKPALPPDQGPPPPPPAGTPCTTDANCVAGLQKCFGINGGAKKCYNVCAPTDPCGVITACAQNEACVPVKQNTVTVASICYATKAVAGGACGTNGLFCPNGTICAMPSTGGTYTCRYTCNNPGAVCAGGTCQTTNQPGCNICL
jgi:hypothetical protein